MKGLWITLSVLIMAVLAFFMTSLVMADMHENSLIDEWKSWLPEISETVDDTADTEVTETTDNGTEIQIFYEY